MDEMLIDIDQLDEHNKQLLLEFLQEEYEKNPGQFAYSQDVIKDYMIKQQQQQAAG